MPYFFLNYVSSVNRPILSWSLLLHLLWQAGVEETMKDPQSPAQRRISINKSTCLYLKANVASASVCDILGKNYPPWAGEVAQRVRVLAAKPNKLSSSLGTSNHGGRKESTLMSCPLTLHVSHGMQMSVQIGKQKTQTHTVIFLKITLHNAECGVTNVISAPRNLRWRIRGTRLAPATQQIQH